MNVFKVQSLNRRAVRWEQHLWDLTPVQQASAGGYYKREDAFAPLGEGGINGMKLRQLVQLLTEAVAKGARAVVTGASVLSPQVCSTAAVARHLDLPCYVVLGGTKPETCGRHPSVAIAERLGARLVFAKVGYNPALQAETARQRLALEKTFDGPVYQLCYGITTPPDAGQVEVERFHALGAHQVENLPADVHTLHVTAGSCNSMVSVLYGIAKHPEWTPNLRNIVLYEIGPSRRKWVEERFLAIYHTSGLFVPGALSCRGIKLTRHDLHGTGFAAYQDRMPGRIDGIPLHPNYEGKLWAYRNKQGFGPGELFWIVGAEPLMAPMERALQEQRL